MIIRIVGILLILALIGGGAFYFLTQKGKTASTSEDTTSVEETPTATPTPEEVAKDEYKIIVQNGSGIEGEAGRAEELLNDAGFDVIETANADNYDYEESVILASSDVSEEWIDELKKELETKYSVKASVEELTDSSDADVIVVVGSFDQDGTSMAAEEEESTDESADDEETETTTTPSPSPSPTKAP